MAVRRAPRARPRVQELAGDVRRGVRIRGERPADEALRVRPFDADERDPGLGRDQLDVVGDDQALEGLDEGLAGTHVDVEEQRVVGRRHARVGDDASLDGEEQSRTPVAGPERRHVVGQHTLEERHAVGTACMEHGTEAEVDERRAFSERSVLAGGVAELTR